MQAEVRMLVVWKHPGQPEVERQFGVHLDGSTLAAELRDRLWEGESAS